LLNIEVPRCIDNSVINTISLQLDQKRLSHQVKKKLVKSGYTLQFTIDGHEFSQTNTLHRIEIYSDLRFESKNPKARKLSVAVSKIEIREKS